MKYKAFFIIFQQLSASKNCLRTETVSLTVLLLKDDFRVISQKL